MNFDEIEYFLNNTQKKLSESQSTDFLYDLYIELTIHKNELHKLIHFCVDDYERKQFFSAIDLAISLQYITDKKIKEAIKTKSENLKYDFEIEKEYLQNEIEKYIKQTALFKEFCRKLLPNKEFSQIDDLARHCRALNMSVKNYIEERMFKIQKWDNE